MSYFAWIAKQTCENQEKNRRRQTAVKGSKKSVARERRRKEKKKFLAVSGMKTKELLTRGPRLFTGGRTNVRHLGGEEPSGSLSLDLYYPRT